MSDFLEKRCEPCEAGVFPLSRDLFTPYLTQIKDWNVRDDQKLEREFIFKNFKKALFFVNEVGALAEKEGHHPDINLHEWNKVHLSLSTHAIHGLSLNDFILAAKIDNIFAHKKE